MFRRLSRRSPFLALSVGTALTAIGVAGWVAGVAQAVPAHNAVHASKSLPTWFHWAGTSDHHKGHPCIIVWAKKAHRIEMCSDGFSHSS